MAANSLSTSATVVVSRRAELKFEQFRHEFVLARIRGKLTETGVNAEAPLSDPMVAMADALACICDVLGFYQERIVNEGYLATATQPRSVFELARAVGYRPGPAIAATSYVRYAIDKSLTEGVVIPAGSRIGAIPTPGKLPPVFETTDDLFALPELNALEVVAEQLVDLEQLARQEEGADWSLPLEGAELGLQPGHLLRARTRGGADLFLSVATVAIDRPKGRTIVATGLRGTNRQARTLDRRKQQNAEFEGQTLLESDLPQAEVLRGRRGGVPKETSAEAVEELKPDDDDAIEVFRRRATLFGASAPELPSDPRKPAKGRIGWSKPDENDSTDSKVLDLDGHIPTLLAGSRVCIATTDDKEQTLFRMFRVNNARMISRNGYGITGNATRLTLNGDWLDGLSPSYSDIVRNVEVFHDAVVCRLLARTVPELSQPHYVTTLLRGDETGWIAVRGHGTGLTRGRQVILTGAASRQAPAGHKPAPQVLTIDNVHYVRSTAERGVNSRSPLTLLHFVKASDAHIDPATVVIYANVAAVTHGETYEQVLGSGEATRSAQRFVLSRTPLTYLPPAVTEQNERPEIAVTVSGEAWQQVDTLITASAEQRVFAVDVDHDGIAHVGFGNGENGARLPSGTENVLVSYRVGAGTSGNVSAGQIKMPVDHPFGVQEVVGLAAFGGVDAEPAERIRSNAPTAARALGRIVSLSDFEAFARTYPGVAKAKAIPVGGAIRVTVLGDPSAPLEAGDHRLRIIDQAMTRWSDSASDIRVRPGVVRTITVRARVRLLPGVRWETTRRLLRDAFADTFSFERRQLGQSAYAWEVLAALQSVEGVDYVALEKFGIGKEGDDYQDELVASSGDQSSANAGDWGAELLIAAGHTRDSIVIEEDIE